MTKIRAIKSSLIILGLLIVGIVLVLVFALAPEEKPSEEEPIVQEPKTQYLKALAKEDKSACAEIKDKYYYNLCLYSFTLKEAVEKKDPLVCEGLKEDSIETCQDNYYFQLAQKEKNLELCSKIGYNTLKDQCEEKVKELKELEQEMAEAKGTTLCDELEGEEVKSVCLSLLSLTTESGIFIESQCRALENSTAEEICFSVVRNQDKITIPIGDTYPIICNDIENQEAKDLCLDFFEQLSQ